MPLFGPPNINKLKEKKNINGLIKALKYDKYKHRKLRVSAAEALGEIGDAKAIEALITFYKKYTYKGSERQASSRALLKIGIALSEKGDLNAIKAFKAVFNDKEHSIRKGASEGLIRLGAPSVPSLISFNKVRDFETRKNAKQALVEIGEPAIIPLVKTLRSQEKSIYTFAVQTLEQINWQPKSDEDGAWYWLVKKNWNSCAAIGIPAIKPLIFALEKGEAEAVTALSQIDDQQVIPVLEKTILSPNTSTVQLAAVQALGRLGDPKSINPLLTVLKDEKRSLQDSAATALCQIKELQGVEPLIALMNVKQKKIYKASKKALVDLGEPALIPLINALSSKNPDQIEAIIITLGEIGNDRAVKSLLPFLKDENEQILMATIIALGKVGDTNVVDELKLVLRHKNEQVRKVAAAALEKLGWTPANDEFSAQYWADKKYWKNCAAVGPSALNILLPILQKTENQYNRRDIIKGLGNIGDVRAVSPILTYLTNEHPGVREQAVIALGAIGDPSAVKPLKNALLDKNDKIRKAAFTALGKIGDQECITYLIQFLPDSNAMVALSKAGSPAIEPLINQLISPNEDIRRTSSDALGIIGDNHAVDPLIKMLEDISPKVKKSAIHALGMIGDRKAVKPLINQLMKGTPDEVRQSAVDALGRIGDSKVLEPMFTILNDQKQPEALRREIIYTLGKFKQPKIVEVLIDQLKDESRWIKDGAAQILGELGDSRSVEPLIAILPQSNAVQALGKIGDPRALKPLIKLLKETEFSDFQILMHALAALHKSGNLDEAQKQYILQQGDALHRRWSRDSHHDQGSGCSHYDWDDHTDKHADFSTLL